MPPSNRREGRWGESKSNARLAKIPIAKARQVAKHLAKAVEIANEYNCQIFISPTMAGLYHQDRMFSDRVGAGVNNEWEIISVNGPFDGGDF